MEGKNTTKSGCVSFQVKYLLHVMLSRFLAKHLYHNE